MAFDVLVALAVLALVISVSTLVKGMRKLCEAERLVAKVRRELADCEQARRELQEFAVLFNYGAREEAYEHLLACGFKTAEANRPQGSV